MATSISFPFLFEKRKLLYRKKHVELWDGLVQGRPHLIKRFSPVRPRSWDDYLRLSRLKHPLLLQPHLAGFSHKQSFCLAMPIDFEPEPLPQQWDTVAFAVQFLSLACALRRRETVFRWDPKDLVFDPKAGTVFLAGVSSLHQGSADEPALLKRLEEFLSGYSNESNTVVSLLKKWGRRKKDHLTGCLQELLGQFPSHLTRTPCVREWRCEKELELVTGLFQLAERSRGRAILFEADAGEGKSTLLRQVYCELLPRRVSLTYFAAQREERPYHSARKMFFENVGAYRNWKSELAAGRWIHFVDGSMDFVEEVVVSNLLRLLEKIQEKNPQVYTFLIDDVHHFDPVSLSFLTRLLRQIENGSLLFVLTARENLQSLSDAVIRIPVEVAPANRFLHSYFIPFWKPEQQSVYFEQIHRRTSGNPLLFHDFLKETIRQRQSGIVWTDGDFAFQRNEIPVLPGALLEFYAKSIPRLSEKERTFLEMASVQGESFDPALCEKNKSVCGEILDSLKKKGVVIQREEQFRFWKPLLAEAIYQKIEATRLQNFHHKLANELLKKDSPELNAAIARHFLKGGDCSSALVFVCKAIQETENSSAPMVLPILDELEDSLDRLKPSERLQFYTEKGKLLFQKGKYLAAIESYQKALPLVNSDFELHFDLAVKLAQSHLLNNDILGAQKILHDQNQYLPLITDEKALLRFYFARGFCAWHRGERQEADFEKAFDLAENQQDYDALANGYRQRAELTLREGAIPETKALCRKALRYSRKTGNYEEWAHALRILGSIAWRQSRYASAERILKRSIRAFERVENQDGIARVWSLLGNIYVERYRFPQAMEAFENALTLFSRLNHPLEVSLAQFNMGLVYVELCRFQEAEKIFNRCYALDKKVGNKRYYAYDLRAMAVVSILRGFPKKASRLLKRTIDICQELQAEGDILQTKLIFLLNELEQKNYRQAQPLVESLESQLPKIQEPMTRAEIHYLLAHYYGFINETGKANQHIDASLQLARRIHYYKLTGKNLILRLVFKNCTPSRTDPDLKKAIRCFERSRNELEFADYMLKLYQAYPALLREREHARRLIRMEKIYRAIRHRPKHQIVRLLSRRTPERNVAVEPLYEWWQGLLTVLSSSEALTVKLTRALTELSAELQASASMLQYLNERGIPEQISYPENHTTDIVNDLCTKVHEMISRRFEPLCLNLDEAPDLSQTSWALLYQVRSVLAIPVLRTNHLLGMWYFERRGTESAFSKKDLQKASFFSMAATPTLEHALEMEFSRRSHPVPEVQGPYEDLIGISKPMMELYRQMAKLAPIDISVLIVGDSGTGKELIARNLHRKSKRVSASFLALNCSALPESLIESELFGYVRGAFTGATGTKQGLIERANGGTLFLDEIGDLSPAAQAKLLRVMQEREIQRLGDTIVRKVNVRFLFATHKDLKKLVQEKNYREDLYYRISVYTLSVPPLRDRREDMPSLISHFIGKYGQSFGRSNVSFSSAAMRLLTDYSWPGNVREMENLIQSLLINIDSNATIDVEALPAHIVGNRSIQKFSGLSLEEARQAFEREFILEALNRHRWNKTHTARELKMTRQGLISMIQRLGLVEPEK